MLRTTETLSCRLRRRSPRLLSCRTPAKFRRRNPFGVDRRPGGIRSGNNFRVRQNFGSDTGIRLPYARKIEDFRGDLSAPLTLQLWIASTGSDSRPLGAKDLSGCLVTESSGIGNSGNKD